MTNIVMLSYGRLRLLKQAIETLSKYTDPRHFTLTIVSDDEHDFRVTNYLKTLVRRHVSILEVNNSGHVLATLKNLGVWYSRARFGQGDWLYLSDSDVAFTPDWLNKLTAFATEFESLSDTNMCLFGGQVHPYHQPIAGSTNRYDMLDGPSWLMRFKVWNWVGGLEGSEAGVCKSEDVGFCRTLTQAFGGIAVIQPHVVIHTGLTNSDGKPAPGADLRKMMIPEGVIAE